MNIIKAVFFRDGVLILLILVIGLVIFWPTFSLALYGDEWQMLWYGKAIGLGYLNPQLAETWNAYWNEMVVFNFLASIFGYQGFHFYLLSFICRFLAALFLYIFLVRRSLGRVAAFSGSLLFMVTPVGIEATDWARNFDSYIGIIFLLIGVDLILGLKSVKQFLFLILCFIIGTLVNPLRSHGLLIVFTSMLIVQICLSKLNKKNEGLSLSLFAMVCLPILYGFFILTGVFGKLAGHLVGDGFQFGEGVKSLLAHGGNVLAPNFSNQYFNFQLIIFLVLSVVSLIYLNATNFFKQRDMLLVWILGLVLVGGGGIVIYLDPLTTKSSVIIELCIVFILVLKILIDLKMKRNNQISLIFLSLIIGLGYMIYPTLRQSLFHSSFDHRYLIYPALVVPILCSLYLEKVVKEGRIVRVVMWGLLGLVSVSYIFINSNYLELKKMTHNSDYCNSVRNQIFLEVRNVDFKSSRKFFIFQTPNAGEEAKIYDCLTFGFMYDMGIHFHLWQEDDLPVAIYENGEGIKSMLTDGKTTKKYLGYDKIILPEDLFIFEISEGQVKPDRYMP